MSRRRPSSTTSAWPVAERRRQQRSFKQYIERPATLCIPLLLAAFWLGNGSDIYKADFFQVPTDFWLSVYWIMLCGTLVYLLGYGARAMLEVAGGDPRSRRIANIYLIASLSGMLAWCRVRITTALVPGAATVLKTGKVRLIGTCGAVFALAAAFLADRTKWLASSRR